ncbi:Tic22 family protein [Leptolyngbya sp. FACHB-261]|uniref:Tic22 family protein n=1 Tax=Leptolyngbya sp. FACHB-261 TaxID=2692806 RepID=UPI0016872472|nr:Tic22 family protein [Leptolyngbya sp. FACHB-261]MBD2104000.1 hypothetical protein [Leptolyngbya sp. FACHB-261]
MLLVTLVTSCSSAQPPQSTGEGGPPTGSPASPQATQAPSSAASAPASPAPDAPKSSPSSPASGSSSASATSSAQLPLAQDQVLQRLDGIPVFTLANAKGAPITASSPQVAQGAPIVTFFLSYQEAQQLLTQLRSQNPSVGREAKIMPLSLSRALQLAHQQNPAQGSASPGAAPPSGQQRPIFQFRPNPESLQAATKIQQANGQSGQSISGVPVFFLKGASQNQQGLVTISRDGKSAIPFFFDQQDAKKLLDQLQQKQPDLAKSTRLEVTSLTQVLSSELDPATKATTQQFTFVPSRAEVESAQSLKTSKPAS